MYCAKCGNPIADNVAYCPHCGSPVSAGNRNNVEGKPNRPKLGYLIFLAHGLQVLGSVFLLFFPVFDVYYYFESTTGIKALDRIYRRRSLEYALSIFRGHEGDWSKPIKEIQLASAVLGVCFIFAIAALIALSLMKQKYKISGIGGLAACVGVILLFRLFIWLVVRERDWKVELNAFSVFSILIFAAAAILLKGGFALKQDTVKWMLKEKSFKTGRTCMIVGLVLGILLNPIVGLPLILIGLVFIVKVYWKNRPE